MPRAILLIAAIFSLQAHALPNLSGQEELPLDKPHELSQPTQHGDTKRETTQLEREKKEALCSQNNKPCVVTRRGHWRPKQRRE